MAIDVIDIKRACDGLSLTSSQRKKRHKHTRSTKLGNSTIRIRSLIEIPGMTDVLGMLNRSSELVILAIEAESAENEKGRDVVFAEFFDVLTDTRLDQKGDPT